MQFDQFSLQFLPDNNTEYLQLPLKKNKIICWETLAAIFLVHADFWNMCTVTSDGEEHSATLLILQDKTQKKGHVISSWRSIL